MPVSHASEGERKKKAAQEWYLMFFVGVKKEEKGRQRRAWKKSCWTPLGSRPSLLGWNLERRKKRYRFKKDKEKRERETQLAQQMITQLPPSHANPRPTSMHTILLLLWRTLAEYFLFSFLVVRLSISICITAFFTPSLSKETISEKWRGSFSSSPTL